MLCLRDWQADPACGKDAPKVPVGKEGDGAVQAVQASDQCISTQGHFGGRLAIGAAVTKEIPAGAERLNFLRCLAFVVAVVPLC